MSLATLAAGVVLASATVPVARPVAAVAESTAPADGGCAPPAVLTTAGDTGTVTPQGFALTPARLVDPAGGVAELCLWVADAPDLWARGLMYVTDLGGADGMVFVFDDTTEARFYMWQTLIPLTVAFFDDAGRLVSATGMKPCPSLTAERCRRYAAAGPYRIALEVPAGALDEQLVEGVRLELAPDGSAG